MSVSLVLILFLIESALSITTDGVACYDELNRDMAVFGEVPVFDTDLMSVARCRDACPTMKPAVTHVALTNGKICLCGIVTGEIDFLISDKLYFWKFKYISKSKKLQVIGLQS